MPANRPLSRTFIKLAARLVGGKSRGHAQDWIPGLRLVPASPTELGSIYHQGILAGRLVSGGVAIHTQSPHVYIVGTGPSIEGCDLSLTESKSCILLNGALHLMSNHIKTPLAVVIEDERFVWNHFDLLERIPLNCPCVFSVSVIRAVCERNRDWLQERQVVLYDDLRKPYRHKRRSISELRGLPFVRLSPDGEAGFSTEPDAGVFRGGSVVISAVQLALSLRVRTIGFLGIDINNANQPRFYEKAVRSFSGIQKGQDRILRHLVVAKEYASEKGVMLKNYSPISALEALGLEYSDRFSRKLPAYIVS